MLKIRVSSSINKEKQRMPNYQNGKIYSIRSHSRPDLIYVGSTIQPLSVRFGGHKAPRNKASSKQIISIGDAYIELIENYACNSKEELCKREGELIRSMDCVNKVIPGRTNKEWRQDNAEMIKEREKQYYKCNLDTIKENQKQYREDNAETIKDQTKKYYKENREAILEYHRQYHQKNVEKVSDYNQQYYQDNKEDVIQKTKQYYQQNKKKCLEKNKERKEKNKEKLKQIRLQKITCECGITISIYNKQRHFKSKQHKFYVDTYNYIHS